MNQYTKIRWIGTALLAAVLCGCGQGGKQGEAATMGEVTMAIDESFQPLMATEIDTFMGSYRNAKVKTLGRPEGMVMNLLLKDSAKLAIMTRELNEEEKAAFKKANIYPHTTKIAVDAVALILNKENPDSTIEVSQLREIFQGNIKAWNQINNSKFKKDITVVFDHSNSSNWLYMKTRMGLGDNVPSNIFAVNSNKEVIEYVKAHPSAMGVIGVNWISDDDDAKVRGFRKEIKVMNVSDTSNTDRPECGIPYQGCIATRDYPLTREVYIVSRQSTAGLATGLTAFVAGSRGQTIVLKAGLIPATAPLRLVSPTKKDPTKE